ncbi:hypothetical protein Cpir12675_004870 [Ceratocystis pirilliformis]|uniref:Vps72/YL1 C-terminal domain-containing protein n=1 Tax=Ceratocystis pirilliformis TaxID=259994 RepID=A0ABR3YTK6_9PEZI
MALGRGRRASRASKAIRDPDSETASDRHTVAASGHGNIRDDESLSSLTSLDDDDSQSDDDSIADHRTKTPIDSTSKSAGSPLLQPPPSPPKVEWLATSRSRRSTAGNRMKSMLASEASVAEDPDSDLELLFAEDENDAGFVYEGNDDDLNLDSSDDDEDNENDDELEGERELERLDKASRLVARKRHAQAAIPAKFRKKVRIQQPTKDSAETDSPPQTPSTTATGDSASRRVSRKRAERTSWLPSATEKPIRASERKTTRISKEQLHQRMREGEERRKKLIAAMERQAKKRAALKKPPLTQDQRIAEAALVEKRNAKSLNRWEEAEKQREEERRAKLAALNNRTLKGPVITYWSGVREWNDNMNGAHMALEEKPKRKRATKAEKDRSVAIDNTSAGDNASQQDKSKAEVEADKTTKSCGKAESVGHGEDAGKAERNAHEADETPRRANPQLQPQDTGTEVGPPEDDDGDVAMADAPPTSAVSAIEMSSTPQLLQPHTPTKLSATPAIPAQQPAGLQLPPGFAPPSTDIHLMPPPSLSHEAPIQRPMTSSVLAAPVLAPPHGAPDLLEESLTLSMGMSAPTMSPGGFLVPPLVSIFQRPSLSEFSTPGTLGTGSTLGSAVLAKPPLSESPSVAVLKRQSLDVSGAKEICESSDGKVLAISEAVDAPDTPHVVEDNDKDSEKKPAGPAMRTAYILQNFDENIIKDKTVQTQILFGQKMNRIAKPQAPALCAITNMPAKYRDPVTGLPYHNAYAYKQIQKLRNGDFNWSSLLGAYVGSTSMVAQNVPARFLTGKASEKENQDKANKAKEDDKSKANDDSKTQTEVDGASSSTDGGKPDSTTVSLVPGDTTSAPQASQNTQTSQISSTLSHPSSVTVSTSTTLSGANPLSTPNLKTSTGATTILQPPIVPLTQPHLLRPPPPVGLPPQPPSHLAPSAPPLHPSPTPPTAPLINGQAWGIPRPPPIPQPRVRPRQSTHTRNAHTKPSSISSTPLAKPVGPPPTLQFQSPLAPPSVSLGTKHGLVPRPTTSTNPAFRPVASSPTAASVVTRPAATHPNPVPFLAQPKLRGFTPQAAQAQSARTNTVSSASASVPTKPATSAASPGAPKQVSVAPQASMLSTVVAPPAVAQERPLSTATAAQSHKIPLTAGGLTPGLSALRPAPLSIAAGTGPRPGSTLQATSSSGLVSAPAYAPAPAPAPSTPSAPASSMPLSTPAPCKITTPAPAQATSPSIAAPPSALSSPPTATPTPAAAIIGKPADTPIP